MSSDYLSKKERQESDAYKANLSDDTALDILEMRISGHTDDYDRVIYREYRFLFGDKYNNNSGFRNTVENSFNKEVENFIPPSHFEKMPREELEEYAKGIGLSPETLLKEGEKYTNIIVNPDFADSVRDRLLDMPLETVEDFAIFKNMYDFSKDFTSPWRNSNGDMIKGNIYDIFNERSNKLRQKGMSERYIANKLNEIQNLAKEYGYNYDLNSLIQDRVNANRAQRASRHAANKKERERWIKHKRANDLEKELDNFQKGSPEYIALEKEIHNLTIETCDPELGWKHQTLELPAPREGAPMFEGGAVPSILVQSDTGASTPNVSSAGGGGNQPPQNTTTAAPEADDPRRKRQEHINPDNVSQEVISETTNEVIKQHTTQNTENTQRSHTPEATTQRVIEEAIDNKHIENQYDNQKFNTQEQVENTVNNNTADTSATNTDKTMNTNSINSNTPPEKGSKPLSSEEFEAGRKKFNEKESVFYSDQDFKDMHDAAEQDMDNAAIDTIEEMYNNNQLTDEQYTQALNNVHERRKYIEEQGLPMDERLERVEQRYASGEYDDKRYATELNKIYESNDVPTMTPEQAERNMPLDSRLERVERLYAEGKFDDTQYADALNKIYSDVDVPTMTPEMARRKQTSQNSTKYKNVFEKYHANKPKPGPTGPIIENNLPIPQDLPVPTGPTVNPQSIIHANPPAPKKIGKFATAMSAFNLAMSAKAAVDSYKESRSEGKGAVSSAVRAGGAALITNSLGGISSIAVPLAYAAPGAIMSGMDMLHREYRRMNSSSNFIPFGKAEFQDSQDLATMRQAGMELAKMSRYNLEQTLMGAEAKHLHR